MQDNKVAANFAPISWAASDGNGEKKTGGWYGRVTLIFIIIIAADVAAFFFHLTGLVTLISSLVVFGIMYIALLLSARVPDNEYHYTLSPEGLSINGEMHEFNKFKAFGVRKFPSYWQLIIIPINRFGMEITVHIGLDQADQIVNILSSYVPLEDIHSNHIDNIVTKLKF